MLKNINKSGISDRLFERVSLDGVRVSYIKIKWGKNNNVPRT